MTNIPPDFNKMLEQSNQGNLHRFSKLTEKVSDIGVYAQAEIKKLQQQIDRQEQRIDQLAEARNNMLDTLKNNTAISKSHNNRIKVLEEPKVIYPDRTGKDSSIYDEPKRKSFIKRLFG